MPVAFVDREAKIGVMLSCGDQQCVDLETAIILAKTLYRNLERLRMIAAPKPAANKPGEPLAPQAPTPQAPTPMSPVGPGGRNTPAAPASRGAPPAATNPGARRVVEALAPLLPAQVAIIPGAGHNSPLTHADQALSVLLPHLRGAEAQRRRHDS